MSRWNPIKCFVEIEKAGSGIEKAGSGIEKAGSGIEKAGSGISTSLLVFAVVIASFAPIVSADLHSNPAGTMQIVVDRNSIAASWIVDGSIFSGVSTLSGSYVNFNLTEVRLAVDDNSNLFVAGAGTGKEVAGAGTGKEVAGAGTGKEVAGAGTGKEVAGAGTGAQSVGGNINIQVAGSGTGREVAGAGTGGEVAGAGTGRDVAGAGTGSEERENRSSILIAGAGTGSDAIRITLPGGTDMQMEVSLGCNSADVTILDGNFVEVVSFSGVPAIGASAYCHSNRADYPLLAGNFEVPGDFERDK